MKNRKLLAFEKWFLYWLIGWIPVPYYVTVFGYFLLELAIIILIFKVEQIPFWQYSIPIFSGLFSVNSIVVFYIHLGNFLEKYANEFSLVVSTNEAAKTINAILDRDVYSYKLNILFLIIVLSYSFLTIWTIGLVFPSETVTILAYIAYFLIMGFMAFFMALGVGIWHFMYEVGKLPIRVRLLHPDNMGGLGRAGELGLKLSLMVSSLSVIYSLGAIYAPYRDIDISQYAYLWIVLALFFLIVSFFLPSFSFHKALKKEKEKGIDKLSKVYDLSFKDYLKEPLVLDNIDITSVEKQANILKFLEYKIENMSVWPYSKPVTKFGVLAMSQVMVFFLQQYGPKLCKTFFG